MPRQPSGQIREHADVEGVVSYSVRFRGRGYPRETIRLGRSDEGMTRAGAEHEARLIAAQILAGTWAPPLKADYVERDVPTIAELADEHYQRKIRKGLRPSSLADMKRKLEIHLLPHFGHITVTELTRRDVEAYLDRKLAENRRIEAARAIGEPLIDGRGRALQTLRPQTINSHLHLFAEILARAVREGLLARNPAEGEDLRLEAQREKKYGLELDEAMALVEAAGTLDQRPAPSDALRRRIRDMRAAGTAWRVLAADLGIAESTAIYHANRVAARPLPDIGPSSRRSRSQACASARWARSPASPSLRPPRAANPRREDPCGCSARRHPRRPAGGARRVQGRARRRVAARDARVPQRPRQALDTQRDRPARAPPRSEGGQPAARGRRSAGDPRAGHPTHAPLHVHRVAVRRRRRPGVRGRPGRARRHHDDQPHLPVRAAAAAARRDRPSAAVGDARVRHGSRADGTLTRGCAEALTQGGHGQ